MDNDNPQGQEGQTPQNNPQGQEGQTPQNNPLGQEGQIPQGQQPQPKPSLGKIALPSIKELKQNMDFVNTLNRLEAAQNERDFQAEQQEVLDYCTERDPDFDLELCKKEFIIAARADKKIFMDYGNNKVQAFAFWQDFVKPKLRAGAISNRMQSADPRGEELKKLANQRGLSLDEQAELVGLMIK